MDNVRDRAGLGVLAKAGAVISALESAGELPVGAIAERVDEPVSSTYRLLSSLTALGWVEMGRRRGVYRLGLLFMRIGGLVEDRVDIRALALPQLERLHDETGLTAFLCVPRGRRATCIERVEGSDVRSLGMRLGDSLPLYAGAAPMAILAFLPEAERNGILDQIYAAGTIADLPQRDTVSASIDKTLDRGFSVSEGDVTHGIAAIGAPVLNHRGELEASISVSGLFSNVLDRREGVARQVIGAADRVSAALGYQRAVV